MNLFLILSPPQYLDYTLFFHCNREQLQRRFTYRHTVTHGVCRATYHAQEHCGSACTARGDSTKTKTWLLPLKGHASPPPDFFPSFHLYSTHCSPPLSTPQTLDLAHFCFFSASIPPHFLLFMHLLARLVPLILCQCLLAHFLHRVTEEYVHIICSFRI